MKFSVIIPVHNGAKYLASAVDSVLRQTNEPGVDVDVVLVENGSSDDSGKICDEYAATYRIVTAFHRGRIGAYSARRLGMEVASGEWLLFLDADDELCPGAIPELYRFLSGFSDRQKAPDIVFYNYERVSSSGKTIRTFPFVPAKVYEGEDKKLFFDTMCQGDLLNPLWNKCVKKELALISLTEDEDIFLNHGEDLLQTAHFIDRAKSISYLDKTIYSYRCDNQGLTGRYHKEFLQNQKYAWGKLEEYAEKWATHPAEYDVMLNERKTLTTCIAAKTIVMSDLKRNEVLRTLTKLFDDSFYRDYSTGDLPKWASEEDVFFHKLQLCKRPRNKFMSYFTKRRIKAFIKARIRK